MKTVTINAYAKINLSIDVLGKRPDGYHEVLMVMQQIDLYDRVYLTWEEIPEKAGVEINLTTNLPFLPVNDKNIAYQAAQLMSEQFAGDRKGLVTIHLRKKIPVAAGLAGGSADGAAVLHGLSKLWELHLPVQELMTLGAKLGADIPFCIMGQAALNPNLEFHREQEDIGTCAIASGIGEQLEVVPGLEGWVLLSKPPISVPTAKVYGMLRLDEIQERPNTEELVQGLKEKNYHKILKNMINVLENVSIKEYPKIVYTKNKMEEVSKDRKALMSGSGPTVFQLYPNKKRAELAYGRLKGLNDETFLVKCLL